MSREKLSSVGISKELIDLFIGNTVYSPTEQTRLVNALASMQGVKNLSAFLKVAVRTDSQDVARFRQRQAQLYAAYHRSVKPLVQFDPISNVAAGRTADGTAVIVAPVDYVVWTQTLSRVFSAAKTQATKRELWITGGISDRARAEVEKRGWKIFDRAQARLLGKG